MDSQAWKTFLNMTKAKRWFLEKDNDGCEVILKASDGECIRKPNAKQPLGPIISVQVPDVTALSSSKYSPSETILVSKYNIFFVDKPYLCLLLFT